MSNFYTLPIGTTFKAEILDIRPGKVTIRLEDGGHFTARSLVTPGARIGEESYFRVRNNNFEGLVEIEMIKGSPAERQDSLVEEALKGAGMYNVTDNMDIGRALMENNLPLDAETLHKAAFFRHAQQNDDIEKTIFLLQEGFPADERSLRALDASFDPNRHLSKLLGDLPRLSLDGDGPLKPLNQYYRELDGVLRDFRADPGKSSKDLLQRLDAIEENLAFMQQVTKHVRYYQIPFTYKNRIGQGELFLYRSGSGIGSGMIAIDTENLGRIEVLTTKTNTANNKTVSFNFQGDTDEILSLIQSKSGRLVKDLHHKGFKIAGIKYQKKQDKKERTSILTPAPMSKDSIQEPRQEARRYAFDMRV